MSLVVTAGVLWSFEGLIIRQVNEAGSWTILFWRSLAMLPVIVGFLTWRAKGVPLAVLRKAGVVGAIGGAGLVVAMGGAIVAYQNTTVANAMFLFAASPLLAGMLGRTILGEAVSPRTWMAIGLALVGISIMVWDGLSKGAWVGNIAALLAALGFAAFTVTLRWRVIEDSLPSSIFGSFFAIVAGGALALGFGDPILVPMPDILWCLLMGVVAMGGGFILYTFGSEAVPSAELVLLSNTEVLLGPLWVWLLLGETGSSATFVGGAVLLVAILFNAYSGFQRLSQAG